MQKKLTVPGPNNSLDIGDRLSYLGTPGMIARTPYAPPMNKRKKERKNERI